MLIGHQPKDFLLAVEALTVSFDGFKAVNDLSFYVEENEIRVIIGPNGAGKTTVLDLICGKTKATSGSIQFRGKELTRLKENEIVHRRPAHLEIGDSHDALRISSSAPSLTALFNTVKSSRCGRQQFSF